MLSVEVDTSMYMFYTRLTLKRSAALNRTCSHCQEPFIRRNIEIIIIDTLAASNFFFRHPSRTITLGKVKSHRLAFYVGYFDFNKPAFTLAAKKVQL
jgi:hypothetical protein